MLCNFKRLVLLSLILLVFFSVFTLAQNPAGRPSPPAKKPAEKPSTPAKKLEAAQKFHAGIVNLLDNSPILDPRPKHAFTKEEYIDGARQILQDYDLRDMLDTTEALEVYLEPIGPVTGDVTSEPPGLTIRYFRVIDPKQPLNTTTPSKISLDPPATYTFICTGPHGEERTQTVSCAGGCTVKFKF